MGKCIAGIILAMLCSIVTFGQTVEVEMADTMRSEGKIYVVVAVIVVILLGFIFYLFMVDRKVTRIEGQVDELARQDGSSQPS